MPSVPAVLTAPRAPSPAVLWRFGRPHTLVGTTVSVVALFALAADGSGAAGGTAAFHLTLTLVAALAVNVFIVGINQLEDVEIDRVNKPELPLAAGDLSRDAARVVVAMAGALPLVLALTQGLVETAAVVVALAVGWAYSCPPVRLKRWPLAAAMSITLVRAAVVNLGVSLHFTQALRDGSTTVDPAVWVLLGITVPFAFAIAVLKDVPDADGDRRHGIRTYTVRLGARRATRLGLAGLAAAALGTAGAAVALLPLGVGVALAALALLALGAMLARSRVTPIGRFYRDVWRLFFAAYVAIPAAFLIA